MTTTPAQQEDRLQTISSQEDLRDLHSRLHLDDVRVQRLRAEAVQDPPLDVSTIVISVGPGEVLLEPPRFAVRFTQTVILRDAEEQPLAEVEIVVVVDFTMDDGPSPHGRPSTSMPSTTPTSSPTPTCAKRCRTSP
ncbi:hypothetical protein [Streptomyces sp. SGAir0957]